MWKTARWGTAILAVALSIFLAGVIGHEIGDSGSGGAPIVNDGNGGTITVGEDGIYGTLAEIQKILEEDFVNPEAVDPSILLNGAIQGQIDALGDAHTV